MSEEQPRTLLRAGVERRAILKGLATGGVVLGIDAPAPARGQGKVTRKLDPAVTGAIEQSALEAPPPPPLTTTHVGSDFMIDVIKSLGIDYVAANPGSSFRGLHESLVNHGGNVAPELLTCLHEETSVAMAVGYARATGKPIGVFVHSTVGLQHASMSIYHVSVVRTFGTTRGVN